MSGEEHILIIKHGALGDVVLAQGPFQAIASHHKNAKLTLLTTSGFKDFLSRSGLFDEVIVDTRPKFWNFSAVMRLRKFLRGGGFTRVYDLQTSTRSTRYFNFFDKASAPEWSGIAKLGSLLHDTAHRNKLHTLERQREQLELAGITDFPDVDYSWAETDISRFPLKDRFAVLVPGGSAHRPEKRWPADQYAGLATHFLRHGLQPVVVGGAAEADVVEQIKAACPEAICLTGQTDLFDIATLGQKAEIAVGNDTGPMHLLAANG